jgi:hypothetical protein
MTAIRLVSAAGIVFLGLTVNAAAQLLGPGMGMPGAAPQQQVPPCFAEFKPLRDEAEKRGLALKAAIQKKVSREEACTLIKHYSTAEAKVVKFIEANAQWCGIPAQAAQQMKANHAGTMKTQNNICNGGGMAGGASLDPLAPNSGTLDTLTGNVLAR